LKPSSRSGCPPSRLFTRFTTSPVSDLRMERRRGQRGEVEAESVRGI
jgi:hypothetical protein